VDGGPELSVPLAIVDGCAEPTPPPSPASVSSVSSACRSRTSPRGRGWPRRRRTSTPATSRPRRATSGALARGAPKRSLHTAKLAQIEECQAWAADRLRTLSDDAFFAAGIALYAGEGSQTDGSVGFANTNPLMITFFCRWLRRFFAIDEGRLRAVIYLHEDLDYDNAVAFWSEATGIPATHFGKPNRAVADPTRRAQRHQHGCLTVRYHCSRTHRRIMSLCRSLLSSDLADPA
jgi:hypothetical protein